MIDCLSRLSLAGDPRLPFVNYLSYIKRKNEERWADTDTNRESECKKESTYVKCHTSYVKIVGKEIDR